jgi:hypothetical protein
MPSNGGVITCSAHVVAATGGELAVVEGTLVVEAGRESVDAEVVTGRLVEQFCWIFSYESRR